MAAAGEPAGPEEAAEATEAALPSSDAPPAASSPPVQSPEAGEQSHTNNTSEKTPFSSPAVATTEQQEAAIRVPQQQQETILHRLKVVGIPAGYSEEQLRQLFQLCGNVAESRIVHDKQSGRPVGYGYVSFFSKEAADLAISTFDDQLQLQGATNYLSVYYAKKQHDNVSNDKESCPARNAKLYFCGTPAGLRRDSILALFSAFGRVRHLQVYTDSYGVLSSGTVTMYSTDEAIAAMNSLDGKVLQPGTAPLKVTWAQLSTLPRKNPAGGGPPPPMPRGFTVSYACLPTSVTPAEVAAAFERFGMVLQVVPFAHRREGPASLRGCGLVVMDTEQAAMAAVDALSGVFTWPGAERPLLVQPFYGAERLAPHQLSGMEMPGGGGMGGGQQAGGGGQFGSMGGAGPGAGGGMRGPTNHNLAAAAGQRHNVGGRLYQQQQQQQWSGSGGGGGRNVLDAVEPTPPGCSADAFKLVLTNLPASYTQSDVISLLQPYGTVVSFTHLPPGQLGPDSAALVWYATGSMAEAALSALSNTVLMAAEGTRQLELRAFKGPAARFGGAGQGMGGPQQQQQQMQLLQGGPGGPAATWHSPSASQVMQQQQQHSSPGFAAYQQQHGGFMQQGGYSGDSGVWAQGGAVGAAPPGLTGMGLAPATGGMASQSSPYSMQQLLYMLPQQQQQQLGSGAGSMMSQSGAGTWSGSVMMQGGAVSLSSNSNFDSTMQSMQSMQGATDPSSLLGVPSVSLGIAAQQQQLQQQQQPQSGAGAGYTGWLG